MKTFLINIFFLLLFVFHYKGQTHAYSGFWQPIGSYRYWGSTAFWKLTKEVSVSSKEKWSFGEYSNTYRFKGASLKFGKDGFKLNPQKNDLINDNETASYVSYNGKEFNKVSYDDFVLMIPSSNCGILANGGGNFTTLQNANMLEFRKNIIEQFDNRTDGSIYIMDAGIALITCMPFVSSMVPLIRYPILNTKEVRG